MYIYIFLFLYFKSYILRFLRHIQVWSLPRLTAIAEWWQPGLGQKLHTKYFLFPVYQLCIIFITAPIECFKHWIAFFVI